MSPSFLHQTFSTSRQDRAVQIGVRYLLQFIVSAVRAEIVVFNIKDRDIPIVHRAIKVHERASKTPHTDILTKVDSTTCNDQLA